MGCKQQERISCESYEDKTLEKLQIIHEGIEARKLAEAKIESDKINHNKLVNEYNETVVNLNRYRKESEEKERYIEFSRCFWPLVKKVLKAATTTLKMYINIESINTRKVQLSRWGKSLLLKPENTDKINKISCITGLYLLPHLRW